MRKLSDDQVKALRRQGHVLKSDDGGVYIPKPKVEPKPEAEKAPPVAEKAVEVKCFVEQDKEFTKTMLAVLAKSEDTAAKMVSVMSELAKPKPKKKYTSRVTRDVNGRISTISTEEK